MTQSLSQLSRIGAPQRPLAVAGLLSTATALLAAGPLLPRRARAAAAVAAVATVGAVAFPLDGTREAFRLHAVWVVVGYASFGVVPVLTHRRLPAVVATAVAAAALPLTLVPSLSGVAQRVGLATLLGWLAARCGAGRPGH